MTQNEFSDAFSTAFDPAAVASNPTTLVSCGVVNWGCADEDFVAALNPDTKALAETLAWETLRSLTAYRLGNCPVTVRPCSAGCWQRSSWQTAPVVGSLTQDWGSGMLQPRIQDGHWLNTCGCYSFDDCACTVLSEVILPGPVGRVDAVLLDGIVLDPSTYRVDNGNRLVRVTGGTWPACQAMASDIDEIDTFAVTYVQGFAPDQMAAWSAGLLAVEFAKACSGKKCALPQGVQAIARQGISLQINQDMFEGGSTGLTVVDAYVRLLNPRHVTQAARIYSPDHGPVRTTTWQHG